MSDKSQIEDLGTIKREIDYDASKNIIPGKLGIHQRVSIFIQLQYTRFLVVFYAITWIVKNSFRMIYNEIKMPGFFFRVTGFFKLWLKRFKNVLEMPDVGGVLPQNQSFSTIVLAAVVLIVLPAAGIYKLRRKRVED